MAIQTIQKPPIEEKKRTRKKTNVDPKEPEENSLVKSKHRTRNGGQKKIVLGAPKEIEARMAFRKVMEAFRNFCFRTHQPEKRAQAMFQPAQRQRQGPTRKGQGRCLSSIWTFSLGNTK